MITRKRKATENQRLNTTSAGFSLVDRECFFIFDPSPIRNGKIQVLGIPVYGNGYYSRGWVSDEHELNAIPRSSVPLKMGGSSTGIYQSTVGSLPFTLLPELTETDIPERGGEPLQGHLPRCISGRDGDLDRMDRECANDVRNFQGD